MPKSSGVPLLPWGASFMYRKTRRPNLPLGAFSLSAAPFHPSLRLLSTCSCMGNADCQQFSGGVVARKLSPNALKQPSRVARGVRCGGRHETVPADQIIQFDICWTRHLPQNATDVRGPQIQSLALGAQTSPSRQRKGRNSATRRPKLLPQCGLILQKPAPQPVTVAEERSSSPDRRRAKRRRRTIRRKRKAAAPS